MANGYLRETGSRHDPRWWERYGEPAPGDIRPMEMPPEMPPASPSLMRPNEQMRPVEEYAASRGMGGPMMPQPPGPRLEPPVYQPPEPMGWKKALLGIGLSGAAGLSGQGAQTADQFFYGPQRKAEADYAREYGAYKDSGDSWDKYYGRVMQGQNIGIQGRQLEATERRDVRTASYQRGVLNRGTVVNKELRDPFTGELRGAPATNFMGDSSWENELQTYAKYLFNMDYASLDRFQRMEVENKITNDSSGLYQTLDAEGKSVWGQKLPTAGGAAPFTMFDRPGATTGGFQNLSRTPGPLEEMQGLTTAQKGTLRARYDKDIAAAEWEPQRVEELIRQREIELVRGLRHRRGEKITLDRARAYREVADSQEEAMAWAKEDGYSW